MSNTTKARFDRFSEMVVVQCRLCHKQFQDDPTAAWAFCYECVDEVTGIIRDGDDDLRSQMIADCADRTNRTERTVTQHFNACARLCRVLLDAKS